MGDIYALIQETLTFLMKNVPVENDVDQQAAIPPEKAVEILNEFSCDHPLFPNALQRVISIHSDATLAHAFKLLIDNRILCLPVISNNSVPTVCAQVSMMDIIHHFLNSFTQEEIENIAKNHPDDISVCLDKNIKFSTTRICDIPELCELDRPYSIQESCKLLDVVRIFAANPHVHRVLVINAESKLVNVISQSRVLQLLACVADEIPRTRQTVGELKLGFKDVVTVREDELTFRAFQLMKDHNITAVAAVDGNGILVGVISINDFKLVGYHIKFFHLLGQTVVSYLQLVKKYQTLEDIRPYQLTCTPDDALTRVIKTLTFYRVHRVFIIDESRRPVGVISIHDILKEILKETQA